MIHNQIQIQYRAQDVGRFKTRVSRKSSIRLHVRPVPVDLFHINNDDDDDEVDYNNDDLAVHANSSSSSTTAPPKVTSTAYRTPKTFELLLTASNMSQAQTRSPPSPTQHRVALVVAEDTKLGEKIYQIGAKSRFSNAPVATGASSSTESDVDSGGASSSDEGSIIYFCLLDEGNTDRTFYVSNHDGSLYLVKPLDYESGPLAFNLTVIVTNWLGQLERVHVDVSVADVNDNRPEFDAVVYTINASLDIPPTDNDNTNVNENDSDGDDDDESKSSRTLLLMRAHDADALDAGKLVFSLNDCFYSSGHLLLKKPHIAQLASHPASNHLNYPLCSLQYVRLVCTDELVKLRVNVRQLARFLANSSDWSLRSRSRSSPSTLTFHMDIGVHDSSSTQQSTASSGSSDTASAWSSVARAHVHIRLNRAPNRATDATQSEKKKRSSQETASSSMSFGFRRATYVVAIDSLEQLRAGAELRRFFDECVWFDRADSSTSASSSSSSSQQVLNLFAPFDVQFALVATGAGMSRFFGVDANSGTLFLNRTLLDDDAAVNWLHNGRLVIQLRLACRLASANAEQRETNVLIALTRSALQASSSSAATFSLDELVNRPVWLSSVVDVSIDENAPKGTLLLRHPTVGDNNNNTSEPFSVASRLDGVALAAIRRLSIIPDDDSVNQTSVMDIRFELVSTNRHGRPSAMMFEMDRHTGYVRSLSVEGELDFERSRVHELRVRMCLENARHLFALSPDDRAELDLQTSEHPTRNNINSVCFRQTCRIRVHVLNRNDNEPKLSYSGSNEYNLSLSRPSELLRSMSLFELVAEDADGPLTPLTHRLVRVFLVSEESTGGSNNDNDNECSTLASHLSLDSFELFHLPLSLLNETTSTNSGGKLRLALKLADAGYDTLVKLKSYHEQLTASYENNNNKNKSNASTVSRCRRFVVEIVCEVSDELFANRLAFRLSVALGNHQHHHHSRHQHRHESHMSPPMSPLLAIESAASQAPILHSLAISEHMPLASPPQQQQHLLLLNVSELLTQQQQQQQQQQQTSTLADCRLSNALLLPPSIKLLNYEDVFWLELQQQLLYLRATARLDREARDTYELFLLVRFDCAAKQQQQQQQQQQQSQRFRIVIQVNDRNDNRPVFVEPVAVQLADDLYSYEHTYFWQKVEKEWIFCPL